MPGKHTYIHESLTEPEHDEYDNKREMVAESALAAKTQEVHSAEDEFELLAITIFSVAGMNASRKPQVENWALVKSRRHDGMTIKKMQMC